MKRIKLIILMTMIITFVGLLTPETVKANPYKKPSKYGVNCTWYAWQMAHDKAGVSLPGWGNANTWLNYAKKAGYETGQTPRAKSIVVWEWSKYGHVGYVEKVVGDKIYVWDSDKSCIDEEYPPFKECMDEAMFIDQGAQEACVTQYAKRIACEYSSSYWSVPGDLIGYIYLDNAPKKPANQEKSTTKKVTTKKTTMTTTTTKAKSNNAYLNSLTIDGVDFEFDKEQLEYSLNVKNEITNITINANPEDEVATVQGFGVQELEVGENTFEVIVTAEDESTSTYTLKVTREDKVTTATKVIKKKKDNKRFNIKDYILIGVLIIVLIAVIMVVVINIKKHKK